MGHFGLQDVKKRLEIWRIGGRNDKETEEEEMPRHEKHPPFRWVSMGAFFIVKLVIFWDFWPKGTHQEHLPFWGFFAQEIWGGGGRRVFQSAKILGTILPRTAGRAKKGKHSKNYLDPPSQLVLCCECGFSTGKKVGVQWGLRHMSNSIFNRTFVYNIEAPLLSKTL